MRFRIDPRDAQDPPAAEPAPAAPPVAAPLRAPAAAPKVVAPPPAVRPPSRRIKSPLLVALVVGGLLLAGGVGMGAMYALDIGPFAYPEKYLLTNEEAATIGMRNAPVDGDMREAGVTSNPGEVPEDRLDDGPVAMLGSPPSAAWAQALTIGTREEVVVGVLAMQYPDEEKAKSAASRARGACGFAGGTFSAYRDGDVVVVLFGDGPDGATYLPKVAGALLKKSPDLAKVC